MLIVGRFQLKSILFYSILFYSILFYSILFYSNAHMPIKPQKKAVNAQLNTCGKCVCTHPLMSCMLNREICSYSGYLTFKVLIFHFSFATWRLSSLSFNCSWPHSVF